MHRRNLPAHCVCGLAKHCERVHYCCLPLPRSERTCSLALVGRHPASPSDTVRLPLAPHSARRARPSLAQRRRRLLSAGSPPPYPPLAPGLLSPLGRPLVHRSLVHRRRHRRPLDHCRRRRQPLAVRGRCRQPLAPRRRRRRWSLLSARRQRRRSTARRRRRFLHPMLVHRRWVRLWRHRTTALPLQRCRRRSHRRRRPTSRRPVRRRCLAGARRRPQLDTLRRRFRHHRARPCHRRAAGVAMAAAAAAAASAAVASAAPAAHR